jgi:hypothetical protein
MKDPTMPNAATLSAATITSALRPPLVVGSSAPGLGSSPGLWPSDGKADGAIAAGRAIARGAMAPADPSLGGGQEAAVRAPPLPSTRSRR